MCINFILTTMYLIDMSLCFLSQDFFKLNTIIITKKPNARIINLKVVRTIF
jgi:hypothetical protein